MELLQYFIRSFNGVVGYQFVQANVTSLQLQFKKYDHADDGLLITLFTKLTTAFSKIKSQYVPDSEKHNHIRLNIKDSDSYRIIHISGVIYIPPGKILKLFNLILWYFIRYTTGSKPGDTKIGSDLTKKWRDEERNIRFEINRLPRKQMMIGDFQPCQICGVDTNILNRWRFSLSKRNMGSIIDTRVCLKHRNKLIY